MRVFSTQTVWDVKEQQWFNIFTVDKEECSQEEYYRELESEQCLEDEVEEFCKCCECGSEDCMDFNCTCSDLEVENGNMDYDLEEVCSECGESDCECEYELCQCNDCRTQRHEDTINESVGKAFDKIMESEGCPNCIIDALMELTLEMKRLGWSDHSDYIRECNG